MIIGGATGRAENAAVCTKRQKKKKKNWKLKLKHTEP